MKNSLKDFLANWQSFLKQNPEVLKFLLAVLLIFGIMATIVGNLVSDV